MEKTTNRIRAFRKRMGLSAEQLAEKMDTTQATVTRIETGKQKLSPVWISRFAEALGVEESEIVRSVSTTELIPVIGGARLKKSKKSPLFGADSVYNIPVPARDIENRVGIEYEDNSKSIYICVEVTDKQAANHIGKDFMVMHDDPDEGIDFAPRTLKDTSNGLYFASTVSEPHLASYRWDDTRITKILRIVADYIER